ncbi:MAG TPA: hypothetical protein VF499_02770 [Afipia sp.]
MESGDVVLLQIVVRMIAAGTVVVIVSLVAERSGPAIGGVIAGLPVVLGPGFFFLLRDAEARFVSEAAVYSLLCLCATQVFLCVQVAIAARLTPVATVCLAIAAWAATAGLVRLLPPEPLIAITLFAIVTAAARVVSSWFRGSEARPALPQDQAIMIYRAVLAGSLVAATSVAASRVGARWSGLVMAFPVGYLVVSIAVRAQFGVGGLTQMLHSALLGTTSLAMFCFVLSNAALRLSPAAAFLIASFMSVATAVLLLMGRIPARKRPR